MENELYHYGIKGQKWGLRRFQNKDGTLTEEGKKRYLEVDDLKNIYGDKFNDITAKVAAKLKETGKKDLTNDEIKEILGDDYDRVKKAVSELVGKRAAEDRKNLSEEDPSKEKLTPETIETYAYKVMNGDYGGTKLQKDAFGKNYSKVQKRVKELKRQQKQMQKNQNELQQSALDYSYALVHHGIKGQTWGDRNGPPYPLNASSHSAKEKKAGTKGWTKEAKKDVDYKKVGKIAVASAATVAVSAGAIYAIKHPEQVKKVIDHVSSKTISSLNGPSNRTVETGKKAVYAILQGAKTAKEGFKAGVKEGIKEGPRKAGKAVVTGLALMGVKELTDIALGNNKSNAIWKANDPKQIGKFWNQLNAVKEPDKEEKED